MPIADLNTLKALQPNEYPALQALTVASLSHLPCAAYVLLHIRDAGLEAQTRAAHEWLRHMALRLTFVAPRDAARARKTEAAFNLALTREGLEAFGLSRDEIASFSFPFRQGMNSTRRSTILGDGGEAAPENWQWGQPGATPIHLLLLIFAPDSKELDAVLERERAVWQAANLVECGPLLRAGARPNTREHFGFLDGVGQPVINGTPNSGSQKARTQHETVLNAGEFVLGYTNEDEVAPPSPIVARERDAQNLLPPARHLVGDAFVEDPAHRDLGFNGTYLVFRHLEQHVAAFWNAMHVAAGGDEVKTQFLAAKTVGRWPSGAPLTLYSQATADPFPNGYAARDGARAQVENDFEFRKNGDEAGLACPVGAHIRRANPRDSLGTHPQSALRSARRHRLMRRGRVYGPDLKNVFNDDGEARGLFFLCLCADIERQFEFVQQTWINNSNFSGVNGESDPLLGRSDAGANSFSIPQCPVRERVTGLADFVTTRGGSYFFLPSIPAVQFLASL